MSIQHSDITDPEIHEPKGIASALANTSYVADGAGSGTYKKINTPALKGLSTDGGVIGKKILTDGTEGFTLALDTAYGVMSFSNNSSNFGVSSPSDATLNTDADFALLTGSGATWASSNLYGVTFTTNRLIAPVTGIYRVDFNANIKSFPAAVSDIAFKFRINASAYSVHNTITSSDTAGNRAGVHLSELVSLTAGHYIQVYVGSTDSGNLVMDDGMVILQLLRQTA